MIRPTCAIYGAGGHARVVGGILRAQGCDVVGCFDDSYTAPGELVLGYPLVGRFGDLPSWRDRVADVYIAIGDNAQRERAIEELAAAGFGLPPLVHSQAILEVDVVVEDAAVICMGAILAVCSRVGRGALINTGASVDHESQIGKFTHLAPRVTIAGRTKIGERCFVGIGASIADGVCIGDGATIGAGSVVLGNVEAGERVLGVHKR